MYSSNIKFSYFNFWTTKCFTVSEGLFLKYNPSSFRLDRFLLSKYVEIGYNYYYIDAMSSLNKLLIFYWIIIS